MACSNNNNRTLVVLL